MKSCLRACLLVLLFVGAPSVASGAESLIKAAFLYRFCDYVQWPEEAFEGDDSPLVIGVVGSEQLIADVRKTVAGRESAGRTFRVQALRRGRSLEGIHILYIGADAGVEPSAFLKADDDRPILTVTDSPRPSSLSIIDFTIVEQRVRFDISVARARAVGLELSSDLLAVARNVITEEDAP